VTTKKQLTVRSKGLALCHVCRLLSPMPDMTSLGRGQAQGSLPTPNQAQGSLPTPNQAQGSLPTPNQAQGSLPTPNQAQGCSHARSHAQCPRCKSDLHDRTPHSVERCWALVVASLITFVPANTLPIMSISYFGSGTPDTILSGIIALIKLNMLPVAVVVFIASFVIPLAKILGLMILLVSVKRHSRVQPRQRTMMFRLVEILGKWSMLDVFVVAIMAAVVKLGFITSIEPGPGAVAFAVTVILTMIAAHAFDPRLIWDAEKDE